ncbi:hypothetical protein [Paenibacillus macerans]|uniref:hypothetical protein n=1 Tax=Paenibacillus macerans TaxID=44252 RepID=UPI003D3220A7
MTTKAKETEQELPKALKTFEELKEVAKQYGVEIPLKSPFTPDDVNRVLPILRLPLDEEAIQESRGSETHRGYDTTGYSYQAHVDRMNWVFGPTNWTWILHNESYDDSQVTGGGYVRHLYSAEIELLIGYRAFNEETKRWEWITVHNVPPVSTDHEHFKEKGSARKGMLTKGIKRATSFLGVGADAYLGTLDDDLSTGAEASDDTRTRKKIDKAIDSKGYIQLIELGRKKGFASEIKLREWYKTKSEGAISNDPANLTKAESNEVKSWLFKLEDRSEENDGSQETGAEISEEDQSEQQIDYPKTLDELMSADESLILKIAADYSFQMPASITPKNKGPLCKTLAQLMGIK